LQISKRTSKLVFVASIVSATVPLGVKATRRLRGLLLKNPRVVDEVKAAIALVEQRAAILNDITNPIEGGAPGPSTGEPLVSASSDDIVHVSAADAQSPTRHVGVAVLESGSNGNEGVAEVARGRDTEQLGHGSETLAELQPESSASRGAVAMTPPEAPARRGWSFTSSSYKE
jgi:hypothetical protein